MTILTRLPEDYHENTLAIRSSLQSVRFYVDGELRMEYDTSGTRLVGKNSASCYVFCPTSEDDAGKEVRIELTTNTAKYSGVVNTVYCGDEAAIWGYLFQTYGLETSLLFFCCLPESLRSFLGFLSGLPIRRNLIWNIWAGAFLWQQSGCLVSPRCGSCFFRIRQHLQRCVL